MVSLLKLFAIIARPTFKHSFDNYSISAFQVKQIILTRLKSTKMNDTE